jgi:membrane-associated HD superfamily phosphohydrolase
MSISDWFERRRLVRKGRACDKTRLRTPRDTLQGRLECSSVARWLIPMAFLGLLFLGVEWGHPPQIREHLTLAIIVFISALMLLELDCPEIWRSNSKLLLVLGASWFNLAIIKGIFVDAPPQSETAMSQMYFLCPYTFAPFLITLLLGTRAGLFCVLQVSILASILIPNFNFPGPAPMIDRNFTFLLVSLLSGFTAVYFTRSAWSRARTGWCWAGRRSMASGSASARRSLSAPSCRWWSARSRSRPRFPGLSWRTSIIRSCSK